MKDLNEVSCVSAPMLEFEANYKLTFGKMTLSKKKRCHGFNIGWIKKVGSK